MGRLRQILKTTAVRLTLVYTLLFGLLAVGVVVYIASTTGALLINQLRQTVDAEVTNIARASRRGGVRRLIPMIERRSRRPGANLYLITDPTGRIIAGNVQSIDRKLLLEDGWKIPPFSYQGFDEADRKRKAIARVFTLPGDLRLLVGRDLGEMERFRPLITRSLTISLAIMVFMGLLLWFLVGRRALRHIDLVSESSEQIIAGDLSQRLPISGSGDEFDRLSNSLNGIIARVEKLNSGVTAMSDSIAHDLKTPLTRLRNRAESALLNPQKAGDEVLQEIISDADGLITTFNALLTISQIDAGARSANFKHFDLEPIVRDMHELFEPSAQDQGAQLHLDISDFPTINGNRELLSQVITNLLDNALKYGVGSTEPAIRLRLYSDQKNAIVEVCDNGVGIEPADRDRVRERFTRLDSSRSKPGSGLGLSLVESVVHMHSGRFELENAAPGLSARIVLPRVR